MYDQQQKRIIKNKKLSDSNNKTETKKRVKNMIMSAKNKVRRVMLQDETYFNPKSYD